MLPQMVQMQTSSLFNVLLVHAGGIWSHQAVQYNDPRSFHTVLLSQHANSNGVVH